MGLAIALEQYGPTVTLLDSAVRRGAGTAPALATAALALALAVVAAWRDAEGTAHVMVDRHERGVDWVAKYLSQFAGKRVAIGYDSFSAVAQVEIQKVERMRGRVPQLEGRNTAFIRQAAALFMDDLNAGRIVDAESGEQVPVGERGILTAQISLLGPDWVRTTDLASIDEDGFVTLHGRADGAINRGGSTALKNFKHQELIFATGDNSKVPQERLDQMAMNTDATLRNSLAMAIEYQVRAFHMEAYKTKQIPATLSAIEVREPASSNE